MIDLPWDMFYAGFSFEDTLIFFKLEIGRKQNSRSGVSTVYSKEIATQRIKCFFYQTHVFTFSGFCFTENLSIFLQMCKSEINYTLSIPNKDTLLKLI